MEVNLFLQAGLGNQLFQLAAAYSYAKRFNMKLAIFDHGKKNYWNSLLRKFQPFLKSTPEPEWPKEGNFGYSAIEGTQFLRGFYQSHQYFNDDDIKDMFEFPEYATKAAQEYPLKENAVAVHIRRGDYVDPYFRGMYDVCGPNYWKAAIQRMRSLHPTCEFYVLSDDPEWCAAQSWFSQSDIHIVTIQDEVTTLCLMSRMRNLILCNSSFSWWAAWFSKKYNKEQTVIAPTRWYNHTIYDYNDIYEPDWILINPDTIIE